MSDYAKYKNIVDYHVNKYRDTDVPQPVLRAKAKAILAESQKTYEPSKGTFEAYLNKNMMGLNRFVGNSMQIRMPENKIQKMTGVMNAINEQYGDDGEIDFTNMGKLLNMSPKAVKSIYAGSKRGIISDPGVEEYVPVPQAADIGNFDTDDIYNQLPSQLHKDIFDYAMGTHGKREIKTNVGIAIKLGISESYVRKLKDEILAKVPK